eukprot:COSAG05_NODE_1944_length_3799_cov_9.077027_1_plen_51_part_00
MELNFCDFMELNFLILVLFASLGSIAFLYVTHITTRWMLLSTMLVDAIGC